MPYFFVSYTVLLTQYGTRHRRSASAYEDQQGENGKREPSVFILKKLADLFGVTVDYVIEPNSDLPKEVIIEDKATNEQLRQFLNLMKMIERWSLK